MQSMGISNSSSFLFHIKANAVEKLIGPIEEDIKMLPALQGELDSRSLKLIIEQDGEKYKSSQLIFLTICDALKLSKPDAFASLYSCYCHIFSLLITITGDFSFFRKKYGNLWAIVVADPNSSPPFSTLL